MIPARPSKKTILCIDDDDSILRFEQALLERNGYEVLTAMSGEQGVRLAAMCHCDAVLLDYEMPGMNGREVASEIKLKRPELIIILLSGSAVPTHALALVDAFLLKLDSSRQLLPMIADLCSRNPDPRRNPGNAKSCQ